MFIIIKHKKEKVIYPVNFLKVLHLKYATLMRTYILK